MEYISPQHQKVLEEFLNIAKRDTKAEVECKLLSGKIQTKDVLDRILKSVQSLSIGPPKESQYLTVTYPDNTRVIIDGIHPIHKVCTNNSFREIPLSVERKERYWDGKRDVLDVGEINARFTLRRETPIKKDHDGNPNDPKAYPRLITRKTYQTPNQLFQIDISMVRSRDKEGKAKTLRDILKRPNMYELELEFVGRDSKLEPKIVMDELLQIITTLLKAYYQTSFLLSESDMQRYGDEFKKSGHKFYNPVTMIRQHVKPDNPHNITKGYTVTNKADGERSGLYVCSDGKLLKITPKMQVTWTGLKAKDNSHAGDFVDGEYLSDRNMFCIFDVYKFRKRDIRNLPLMTTDDDKNELNSRLGCGALFVEDIQNFGVEPSLNPLKIETKLFLAGDGPAMTEAIQKMMNTDFGYKTDGLIFTPRASAVAPPTDRFGKTWIRVYKWKPASQNSIDFLMRFDEKTIDPDSGEEVQAGKLYVSRNARDMFVYPRETMTGEYVPHKLPEDFELTKTSRIPSVFQPSVPRDPDAYKILIPIKKFPVDEEGQKVEDNTIIECAFNTETRRWSVMRTRYDKTYEYKVLKEPQYGNDVAVADSIWKSMHIPVTLDMLQNPNLVDDVAEDDSYYREDIKREKRLLNEVYNFHNSIKDSLYEKYIKKGDTLLELAVGKGGDMNRWIRNQPSRIVGMDISLANLASPVDSVSKRYLEAKQNRRVPPVLLVQGDFTEHPLFEQEDKYMPILLGSQSGSTEYLKQFEGLKGFDDVSCQFAMHYACGSEEKFRSFAKNVRDSCKGQFFGTCSDGQAIYSILIGKQSHLFGKERVIAGEYTKMYKDKDTWTEEFGMPVKVMLESFVKPEIEYLVPFGKVTEIMEEMGFELVESKLFDEIYTAQTKITLTDLERDFSFLNRTFAFKRVKEYKEAVAEPEVVVEKDEEEPEEEPEEESKKKEEEDEEVQEVVVPEVKEVNTVGETAVKKRKLKKAEPEDVVLFGVADATGGEYRDFSNMSDHSVEIDGVKYVSVEHYFQAMKATEFKDDETLKKIMKTKTAKAVKALGNKVKDYNEDTWKLRRDDVMKKAVRAKFVQHPELRKRLVETGEKTIGFADARDNYWSIGTSMVQEKARLPAKWKGENHLGKIMMELRKEFSADTDTE